MKMFIILISVSNLKRKGEVVAYTGKAKDLVLVVLLSDRRDRLPE